MTIYTSDDLIVPFVWSVRQLWHCLPFALGSDVNGHLRIHVHTPSKKPPAHGTVAFDACDVYSNAARQDLPAQQNERRLGIVEHLLWRDLATEEPLSLAGHHRAEVIRMGRASRIRTR